MAGVTAMTETKNTPEEGERMPDVNLMVVTGKAVKNAVLRYRSSGIPKAEFSMVVERPFQKPNGEPVSDLFLVDVYGPLAEKCADTVREGTELLVIGTLSKELYTNKFGKREHLVVIKAKQIWVIDRNGLGVEEKLNIEQMRQDHWDLSLLDGYLDLIRSLVGRADVRPI